MKKIAYLTLLILFSISANVLCEQIDIQNDILKDKPVFSHYSEDIINAQSFFEYSWVKQGSRKGKWKVSTNRIAYLRNNIPLFYGDFTWHERFGVRDNTLDFGSYIKTPQGFIHLETGFGGFGADRDYIYKYKISSEIEQKIYKNLSFNLGNDYLHYPTGDVYILSPALVYYFGNHYLSVDYGAAFTKNRGMANFGSAKGSFLITDKVNFWGGVALGERLYDIFTIKASKQYGYILYLGTDIEIVKDFKVRIGYSYSKEDPSFIKRSFDVGASFKF